MSAFNWECPHCRRAVTITSDRRSAAHHHLLIENSAGRRTLKSTFYVCPNPECRRLTLKVGLYETVNQGGQWMPHGTPFGEWQLIPSASAKSFPTYIPAAILDDYREACLIQTLSPKASATLSRRCLQGIIRDYWSVKPGRLVDEIAAIKPNVDSVTWDAIEAVRKIGNIGAHMEKDINVIVDVDPGEAELLIGLVETLLSEWYVQREERNKRMSKLVAAAASKKAAAAPPAAAPSVGSTPT